VLSIPTLAVNVGFGKLAEVELTYEVLCVEEEEFQIKEHWQSGDLAFFTKVHLLDEGRENPTLSNGGIICSAMTPLWLETAQILISAKV
jgi:hypothetical protein